MPARQPGPWNDPLGTALATINHGPYDGGPEEPLCPGVSPGRQHYLANYREYTRLSEWESIKEGLHTEVLPVKRTALSDYLPPEPQVAEPCAEERKVQLDPPAVRASAKRPRTGFRSAMKAAGQMVLASPREGAAPAAAAASPRGVQSMWEKTSPRQRVSPRRIRLQAAAEAAAEAAPESPQGPAEGEEPQVKTTVRLVHPNAVVATGVEQFIPITSPKMHVQDRERVIYPAGRDMRPARLANSSTRQRLNELLETPVARLDAAAKHASRSYEVVPLPNLRIV